MNVRIDNVGIVVEDLPGMIAFCEDLGLVLEGTALVEGPWASACTGLAGQKVEIAMLRTPDGHGRVELSRFLHPEVVSDHRRAPVNALGYLRIMFEVPDLDATLQAVQPHGIEMVSSEIATYEDAYRLCYIRGPEGILVGLAQRLSAGA